MSNLLRAAAVFVAFAASGCYVSEQPFITPETADYPLDDTVHFDGFAARGTTWRPQPGRTVHRVGTHYVYVNDGDTKRSIPFLLKQIGPRRYVLQMSDTADRARITEYYYQLIDFDGTTAIQWPAACRPRQVWVAEQLIERVEATSTNDRCIFTSLDDLATVLAEAVKTTLPEAKYVATVDGGDAADPETP